MTWAQQTYYRAKYGFDENGVLDIALLGHKDTSNVTGRFFRNPIHGEFVTPDAASPGSNHRLQSALEQSRASVQLSRYDETALLHIGPDNTLILTNAAGWGIPLSEPRGYAELDDRYRCHWDVSSATWCPNVPQWAVPERQR